MEYYVSYWDMLPEEIRDICYRFSHEILLKSVNAHLCSVKKPIFDTWRDEGRSHMRKVLGKLEAMSKVKRSLSNFHVPLDWEVRGRNIKVRGLLEKKDKLALLIISQSNGYNLVLLPAKWW